MWEIVLVLVLVISDMIPGLISENLLSFLFLSFSFACTSRVRQSCQTRSSMPTLFVCAAPFHKCLHSEQVRLSVMSKWGYGDTMITFFSKDAVNWLCFFLAHESSINFHSMVVLTKMQLLLRILIACLDVRIQKVPICLEGKCIYLLHINP